MEAEMHGQRIVVTRARAQAGELAQRLRELGAEVIEFPTIEIRPPEDYRPLEEAIARLDSYDWLIFTSANGVRFFHSRAGIRSIRARICAIGPATRRALEQLHFKVDRMPAQYVAESLVEAFADEDLTGKRILLPRAAVARDVVPAELARRGAEVDVVEVYRTAIPEEAPALAQEIFFGPRKPDWITFTSPSTVVNFMAVAGAEALAGVRVASIGPITSEAARKHGISVTVEAESFTTEGLVEAILAACAPNELIERIRAFQESRVLLTGIELDVFAATGEGATAAAVAQKIGANPRSTEMLLNALVAVGALAKQDEVFRNTPEAARQLCGESRLALMHTVHLWPRWSTLTECVCAGRAVARQPREARGEEWTTAFIAAMHRNAAERAALVVEAVGAGAVRRMLDLGGGSGAYSIAFARANPELRAEILDLDAVVPIARGHIERADLAGRVTPHAGDLGAASYGQGFDLVFISAICHMLGPEDNRAMLRKSLEALAPGGRIVIQDFILERGKTAPRHAALFALNMLVGTEEGSSYSEDEYSDWLREVGFIEFRRVRLPGPTGLMIARRP
ncbi:MAG: uroporphyrinogen-III synthase [Bryobacteraceae bacterium]|jgi:uroporphyrinogen-III synthase/predicted O-methyltransferase YrrM